LSIPAVTLRFTAGYRLVFLRNTTMRRLSINIAKLCPTFNHTQSKEAHPRVRLFAFFYRKSPL
ncbi:MAG: hypothetical protein ACKVX9_01995, partial [Blastocatellia bacterium]